MMSDVKAAAIELVEIERLRPYARNPKAHPKEQVEKIAQLIQRYGFKGAILVDEAGEIIAGHGRFLAAQKLGLKRVPVIVETEMTPEEVRAFRIADNRVSESEWIVNVLETEMKALEEVDFEMELTGFDEEEIYEMMRKFSPPERKGKEVARKTERAPEDGAGRNGAAGGRKLVEREENMTIEEAAGGVIEERYDIIITGLSESEQAYWLERLLKEGLKCRAFVS